MSANPGVNIIEWVSRTQGLEADNEKLKKQLREIKEEMKNTVAVAKDLEKERAAAAKAEEQRAKRELTDIQRLEKERERIARQELTDIHKLDTARADYIDREKKGELARLSEERSRLLGEETRRVDGITSAVRGGLMSAFMSLGGTVLTVAGAIGLVKTNLEAAQKTAEDAGNRLATNDAAKGTLAGFLSPSQLLAGEAAVRSLRQRENMSAADATSLVIESYRTGKPDAINFAGSLGDIGYDGAKAMQAHRVFSRQFGAQGSFRGFMNRLAVAQDATGTPLDEIMAAATSAAPMSRGVSANEMTSVAAVLGQRFKEPGEVSTKLTAALKKMDGLRKHLILPPGMEGAGDIELMMSLGDLESRGMIRDDKRRRTTLADVIGRGGAGVIKTMGFVQRDAESIRGVQSAIDSSVPGAAIASRFRALRDNPGRAAVDVADAAKGAADVAGEQVFGTPAQLSLAIEKEREARLIGQKDYGVIGHLVQMFEYMDRTVKGDEKYVREFKDDPKLSPELRDQIGRLVDALDKNTSAMQGGKGLSHIDKDR